MFVTNTSTGLERFWHPVAQSVEVTGSPHQVWLLGEPWAVVRRPDGTVMAARDRCPHRFAPLSAGTLAGPCADEWQCGYHGWRFSEDGHCTAIPALGPDATLPPRARIGTAFGVTERAGIVWLAPVAALAELVTLDELDGLHVRVGWLTPATAHVGAGPMIDNFCDIGHFPFLHAATFGGDEPAVVEGLEVCEDDWGATCVGEHDFANREDPGVERGERPLIQSRLMTFRYYAPFTATLRLEHLSTGLVTVLLFAVQPETDDRCRLYTVLARGGREDIVPDDTGMADALAFEQAVLDEDLALQTRLPRSLPTDPTIELHTRADRYALAVRRILARCLEVAS